MSDDAAADGGPASARVTPPVLVEPVRPNYPPEARERGREARVVLRLSTDETGRVIAVELVESAGPGFDEAALRVAPRLRFEPARRGETPVPARFLYAVDFEPPPPPKPSSATARPTEAGGGASERAPSAPDDPPQAVVEVNVEGQSEAERLRQSAHAVEVIDTEVAKRQAADLGEVLARTQGIAVRRAGGLGSDVEFQLHGLTEDQIRFFLDAVPLELAGYPFGFANIPVSLVDRVEVYRGVLPIRFGADALGGGVNVVPEQELHGSHASFSYQGGSFDTHRLTLGARHLHEPTGFFTRVSGFFDDTDNDYPVDVEVPDERGRLSPATVYRFHDAYRAGGGNLELGVVDRPWADKLLLRAFVTGYAKEEQHNIVMTVPYGEVEHDELTPGATLRYEHRFARGVEVDFVGGYSWRRFNFVDLPECVYDWFGRCVRERESPISLGEVDEDGSDRTLWDHSGFARLYAEWHVHPEHALHFSVAPTYTTRTGDERVQSTPDARDPLTAERRLFTLASGLEYQTNLFDDRLENIAFAKDYLQVLRADEPLTGGDFRTRNRDTHRFGVGDSLRYRFLPWLHAKASYELATRLPRRDEIFGDGAFVISNLELEPEVSHNANLSLEIDAKESPSGSWRLDVNGFLRETRNLIVDLPSSASSTSYENVNDARSLGVEAAAGWTSPGDYFAIDGNVTYQNFRNTSDEGEFGDFEGDRIPNQPYLFANGVARVTYPEVTSTAADIELYWYTRYVHEFFRSWESAGIEEFKQEVESQLLHTLGLSYLVEGDPLAITCTAEVQNITDRKAYDLFGVQRPGRAFYFKLTGEY